MKPKRDFRITHEITMNRKKRSKRNFVEENIDTMAQLVYEINMMIKHRIKDECCCCSCVLQTTTFFRFVIVERKFVGNLSKSLWNFLRVTFE